MRLCVLMRGFRGTMAPVSFCCFLVRDFSGRVSVVLVLGMVSFGIVASFVVVESAWSAALKEGLGVGIAAAFGRGVCFVGGLGSNTTHMNPVS